MYDKRLDTFLLVAEYGSFSRAAEFLYITPSAVIQQINHLELDLGATLFTRTRHGLSLTEAGLYLKQEAPDYIQLGDNIQYRLRTLSEKNRYIYVGTSVESKIRLLYGLWMKYRESGADCEIQPVSIDQHPEIFQTMDLIESLCMDVLWQSDLNFFRLCDVPLGCAVARDHPLASRPDLTPENLAGYTLCIRRTILPANPNLFRSDLKSRKLHLVEVEHGDASSLVWDCACHRILLLIPLCWRDLFPDLTILPCRWNYSTPYGLFYHDPLSEPVAKFLDFIRAETARTDLSRVFAE